MKFLLLLAVLVTASFAAPNLPTTFLAHSTFTITSSDPKVPKSTGKDTWSEDNANKKALECSTYDGQGSTAICRLTDYNAKTLYIYGKDSSGTVVNCTAKPLSGNASTYRNVWVWVPESKEDPGGSIDSCSNGAQVWELQFEGKIDLKVAVSSDGKTPVATDYKLSNSTGFIEEVRCFTSFSTTIDPSQLTPPSSCKSGLTDPTEEDNPFFFLRGRWF